MNCSFDWPLGESSLCLDLPKYRSETDGGGHGWFLDSPKRVIDKPKSGGDSTKSLLISTKNHHVTMVTTQTVS